MSANDEAAERIAVLEAQVKLQRDQLAAVRLIMGNPGLDKDYYGTLSALSVALMRPREGETTMETLNSYFEAVDARRADLWLMDRQQALLARTDATDEWSL